MKKCSIAMPTLLLTPRHTPDTLAIEEAATSAGWNVLRLANWRPPANLADSDLVLYGEPLFAQVVASLLGLMLIEAPHDWLATLPMHYRLREVQATTLGIARQATIPAFIKPADDKCFRAAVYPSGAVLPSEDVLSDATRVLIAEPVAWELELRGFVLERTVVTSSPYLRNGVLCQADDGSWPAAEHEVADALAFSRALLADPTVSVPPAFVLDVGYIRERGWAVIEANAAYGAGIYGCDARLILPVLQRATRPAGAISVADAAWVRELPGVENG